MTRLLPLAALAFAAACQPAFQTTTGADYLAARPGVEIDAEIRAAANVGTPQLAFPGRIAVVQVGRYSQIASSERHLAPVMARAQAAGMGEVILLNPILGGAPGHGDLTRLRQAAARQHADYVLILETTRRGTQGSISAAFVDVRNGYPYATAEAAAGLGWAGADIANRRLIRAIRPDLEAMVDGLAAQAGG